MFPELGNNSSQDDQSVGEWLDTTSNILSSDNFQDKKELKPYQDILLNNFKQLVTQGLRPSLRKKLATTIVKFHNAAETYTVYETVLKVTKNS